MAGNSLGPSPSYFSSPSITTSLLDSCEQDPLNFVRETSVGQHDSPADTPNSHNHLCYKCEDPKPIQRCGDFIRHLKEHYEQYYCMPENAVKNAEDGPRCRVCEILHPDPKHLSKHNPPTKPKCVGRHFSRKDTLIRHHKKHHPKKPQDVDDYFTLAENSKYTGGRKYFACGFCVSGFDSLDEQVNHVHIAHYHPWMQPSGYDINKVILGLLSMSAHWESLRTDNPSLKDSSFTWSPTLAIKLRRRLENSGEPAYDLYKAAFDNCNYGTSECDYVESMPGTGNTVPPIQTNQSMQSLQALQSRLPQPSSLYQGSTAHHQAQLMRPPGQQGPPTAQHHGPWENLDLTGFYGGQPVHPTAFENDGSFTSQYDRPFLGVPSRPHLPPNGGETVMQPVRSFHAPSSAQIWPSRSGLFYDSSIYGPSLGVSPNFTTSTNQRPGAEASTIPEQAQMQGMVPTLASQPWNSSPNHPASRSFQDNSSFAFADPMQSVGPHSQQPEGYNREKLDDSSNSNMQRNAQDNADTKRRRRRH